MRVAAGIGCPEGRDTPDGILKVDKARMRLSPRLSCATRMRGQVSAIASLGAPSSARLMTGGDIAFAQARQLVPA